MIRSLPKFLSEPQMVALACSPDTSSLKGRRDRAILGLLCATGVRASEICSLRVRDVGSRLLFVRRGKLGKQRYVPISQNAARAVRSYLALAPAGSDRPLFRTLDGLSPLTRRLLHKIVSRYARRLKLSGPAVHILRASAATRWLNKGLSLRSVQALLGHESISTTAVYLGVATDALVAEYQRCVGNASAQGGLR